MSRAQIESLAERATKEFLRAIPLGKLQVGTDRESFPGCTWVVPVNPQIQEHFVGLCAQPSFVVVPTMYVTAHNPQSSVREVGITGAARYYAITPDGELLYVKESEESSLRHRIVHPQDLYETLPITFSKALPSELTL